MPVVIASWQWSSCHLHCIGMHCQWTLAVAMCIGNATQLVTSLMKWRRRASGQWSPCRDCGHRPMASDDRTTWHACVHWHNIESSEDALISTYLSLSRSTNTTSKRLIEKKLRPAHQIMGAPALFTASAHKSRTPAVTDYPWRTEYHARRR